MKQNNSKAEKKLWQSPKIQSELSVDKTLKGGTCTDSGGMDGSGVC